MSDVNNICKYNWGRIDAFDEGWVVIKREDWY